MSFDRVRARRMGPQTLVDLTIQTDDMISASAAQQVCHPSSALPWRARARVCRGLALELAQHEVTIPLRHA